MSELGVGKRSASQCLISISISALESAAFHCIAVNVTSLNHNSKKILFQSHFGVTKHIAHRIWKYLVNHTFPWEMRYYPKHLFWTLLFLKTYSIERVLAARVRTTPKTFRGRVRPMIMAIASLGLVSTNFC